MKLWCLSCGDEYDATEVSDTETPLCSDECQDRYDQLEQNSEDYRS